MLRYAGGKSRIVKQIAPRFLPAARYVEPFFGGGWVGFAYLRAHCPSASWINDADPFVANLWQVIKNSPEELKQLVTDEHTPDVDTYRKCLEHEILGAVTDPIADALGKLIVQKQSRGGLGARAGSPIGGWDQAGCYEIDCRWNASRISKDIDAAHSLLKTSRITSLDFEEVLSECGPDDFVYLDPPYWERGKDMYCIHLTPRDHERLAANLRKSAAKWLLSYDDCPEVRNLYSWAKVDTINVRHGGEKKKSARELLIQSEAK